MDRHQLPFCRAQTVAHTVGAGRAAADHGARLGAGRCNRVAGRQVTACHKDQLVHLRVGGKSRLLSFMSMMADKKVGKETFVPIYDSIHKNKF